MIMELVKSQGYHDQPKQDDPLGDLIQSMSSLNKFQIIDTIIFPITSLSQIILHQNKHDELKFH